MIAIRRPQIIQESLLMQHQQLSPRYTLDLPGNRREVSSLNSFSVSWQAKLRIICEAV
jgi:hypothetical protein